MSFEPATAGFSVQRNILNAFVSYSVPIGKGLNLDFGKFTTFIGAEAFDTIDNWNYQQGTLFSYAQPYYHTGLRASYAASDKVGLGFYLVNGWNNSFDNNTGKSVGFSLTLTPSSKFQLIQNYLGGPENNASNSGWRHLYDGILNATINPARQRSACVPSWFSLRLRIWQGIRNLREVEVHEREYSPLSCLRTSVPLSHESPILLAGSVFTGKTPPGRSVASDGLVSMAAFCFFARRQGVAASRGEKARL
jgi:hypothetical protein